MKEDKLIRFEIVMEYVQLGKTTIYNMIKNDTFPKPTKIGGCALWSFMEIQSFIEEQKKLKLI